jgi:hypothetical protein
MCSWCQIEQSVAVQLMSGPFHNAQHAAETCRRALRVLQALCCSLRTPQHTQTTHKHTETGTGRDWHRMIQAGRQPISFQIQLQTPAGITPHIDESVKDRLQQVGDPALQAALVDAPDLPEAHVDPFHAFPRRVVHHGHHRSMFCCTTCGSHWQAKHRMCICNMQS